MNTSNFEAQWVQLKGNVKAEFGKLTDDDLFEVRGNYDIFVGKLQERYEITKDEAIKRANKVLLVANGDA